jgi:tripartite-type tricarboxylate transporter receptor subunit TctC
MQFMKVSVVACVAAVSLMASQAAAQTPAEFYAGKTMTLICSAPAGGGGIDTNARMVARYLPQYVPGNPTLVVRNMPGAGHLNATNFLFNQAPGDGTYIGTVINNIPQHQAIGGQGVRYDAKKFHWLGSTGVSNLLITVWHASGVKSIEDAKKREVVMGVTGAGSGTYIYTNALNVLVGTRFKMVMGYKSPAEIDLAMARGEVMGRGGMSYSAALLDHADWLKDGRLVLLAQVGQARDKTLPNVPLLTELGMSDDDKRILQLLSSPVSVGRPYIAPPATPPDRVAALRKAFDAVMSDQKFLDEARKISMEVNPLTGDELTKVVHGILDTPPALLKKVEAVMGAQPSKGGKKKGGN